MAAKRKSAQESVRAYRQRMRRNGFRQVNLWVPDTRSPEFIRECRRQSRLASAARQRVVNELLLGAAGAVDGWT
ncbi:MAG: antitoxin MazE family protein [Steroidobacteraceae bacterium]